MLSRMTPRLLTWGEGETEELSIVREKLSVLDKIDLVPMSGRKSVITNLSTYSPAISNSTISHHCDFPTSFDNSDSV